MRIDSASKPRFSWLFMSGCLALAGVSAAGCGEDESGSDDARAKVVAQYVSGVRATYADTLAGAQKLEAAIATLTKAPSRAHLDAAKAAWIEARTPYGQTETFRFYEGPIDDPTTGPEGRINGWPLDEVYIDYVTDAETAGIIHAEAMFPTLDKALIAEQNERGGEKNISSGYHAIEFLLWGQDQSDDGPGNRPFTDYVPSDEGPGKHAERRATYLELTAELLVDDLTLVSDAWADETDSYAQKFLVEDPNEGLRRMLKGMSALSGKELSGERMTAAYLSGDQEDEHSCFSDNTLADFEGNLVGIQNVYLGRYGELDGPGIDELVADVDTGLDTRMQEQLTLALKAVKDIPAPLDQALRGADDSPGRKKIKAAIDSIKQVNETLAEVSQALDL